MDASGFILGVDLDGVCGDYTAALREVVAGDRGVEVGSLPLDRSWDFNEWGFAPGDFERLHRAAVLDHRIFRTMPVVEGAAEVLWRLSDAGVWIRIITHRLYVNWGHAIAVADTVDWLDSAGIPYRDLCFLGAKPQVEADCYVEDAPHNVVALRSTGAYVVVFDQPYNRDVAGPRAATWADIEDLVGSRVAELGLTLQAPLPGFEDARNRLGRRVRPGGGEAGASERGGQSSTSGADAVGPVDRTDGNPVRPGSAGNAPGDSGTFDTRPVDSGGPGDDERAEGGPAESGARSHDPVDPGTRS